MTVQRTLLRTPLAHAHHRIQWSLDKANHLPDGQVGRRAHKFIAARGPPRGVHKSGPLELAQDNFQEPGWNGLGVGDGRDLDGTLTSPLCQLKDRTESVLAFLRKHGWPTFLTNPIDIMHNGPFLSSTFLMRCSRKLSPDSP